MALTAIILTTFIPTSAFAAEIPPEEIITDEPTMTLITTEIPGTEKLYPADSVIVSISQGPGTTITDSTKNLKTTPRGLFETDEVGRTSIPGIFASGDAVKGARTVVEAVAYSKNVAEAMHEYMQTLPPDLPDEYANVPVAEYDEGN